MTKKTTTKPKAQVAKPVTLPPAESPPMLHMRWLRVLVIKGHDNNYIARSLQNDVLPVPSDAELDNIRSACALPKNFKLGTKTGTAFLEKMEVSPFFDPANQHAAQALHLLRSPRARELVEAAVITNVPPEAVVLVLAKQLHHTITLDALNLYAGFFFDVGAVSRSQLRVLVQARVREAVMRVTGADDESAARRAILNDARMVAVLLPCSGSAWTAVMLSLGMTPPKRDLAAVASELEQLASVRAGQALLRGGKDDERKAEAYVGVIARIRQVRESIGEPDDAIAKVLRFNMQKDVKPLASVAQLRATGAEVTVNIEPVTVDEIADAEEAAG